jgi:hypothetical protein
MRKLLFTAIAVLFTLSSTFANDTCNCPTKKKAVPRYNQTKVSHPINLEATINDVDTVINNITVPAAQVYMVGQNGENSWILVAIVALVVLALFAYFYGRSNTTTSARTTVQQPWNNQTIQAFMGAGGSASCTTEANGTTRVVVNVNAPTVQTKEVIDSMYQGKSLNAIPAAHPNP